jgi:hypothetical protein
MTEPTETTPGRRSRSHSISSRRNNNLYFLQPVLYFTGMILLLIIVNFMHAGMLSPSVGAFGITLLAVSKARKFKPGMVVSVASIFLMSMIFIWQFTDRYFTAALSGETVTNPYIFREGFSDSFVVLFLLWIYQRLLRSIHLHGSNKWSGKKSFVVILRMLYFFMLFLFVFWLADYCLLKTIPFTHMTVSDAAIVAGAIALLVSGIPVVISFSGNSGESRHRRRHRHHHHPSSPGQPPTEPN